MDQARWVINFDAMGPSEIILHEKKGVLLFRKDDDSLCGAGRSISAG